MNCNAKKDLNGTWWMQYRWTDWTGTKRKSQKRGFKPTYLKTIHNQFSAILNYAVNFYDLRFNPCRKAGSMGKSKADERPYWTLEEYQKFSDAIMDK